MKEMAKNAEPRMKIERPVFKDLKAKVNKTTFDGVEGYIAFYEKKKGVKLSLDETVDYMLADFVNGDKAFQDFLKTGRGAGASPAATSQAGAAGGG